MFCSYEVRLVVFGNASNGGFSHERRCATKGGPLVDHSAQGHVLAASCLFSERRLLRWRVLHCEPFWRFEVQRALAEDVICDVQPRDLSRDTQSRVHHHLLPPYCSERSRCYSTMEFYDGSI